MFSETRTARQATKRNRVSARTRHAWTSLAYARMSDFIGPLNIDAGQCCVPLCRVSKHQQRDNLDDQRCNIVEAIESQGGIALATFEHVGTSGRFPFCESWQSLVSEAALFAIQHDAILVVESSCRLIRSAFWKTNKTRTQDKIWNNAARVRVADLEYLRDHVLFGVEVQSVIDADAKLSEVRSEHTQRGLQSAKRESDKQSTRELVLLLHRMGFRNCDISKRLKIDKSLVSRHINGSSVQE